MLVATKLYFLRQNVCLEFVATNTCLSGQKLFLHRHTFVATKDVFCRDKHVLVATKCDKKVNRDKIMFVATNISRDTSFVATKIILVAAPADDNTTLVSGVVEASAADCDPAVHGQHPG